MEIAEKVLQTNMCRRPWSCALYLYVRYGAFNQINDNNKKILYLKEQLLSNKARRSECYLRKSTRHGNTSTTTKEITGLGVLVLPTNSQQNVFIYSMKQIVFFARAVETNFEVGVPN